MAGADFFEVLLEKHVTDDDTEVATLTAEAVVGAFARGGCGGATADVSLDAARLAALLERHRFTLDKRSDDARMLVFARRSFVAGLFESISIQSAGRRGQVLQTRVGVWFGTHGIVAGDSRLLSELAPGSSTGILLLVDGDHARQTELRLSRLAPLAAATFARSNGPVLLARLTPARRAAAEYFARLAAHLPPAPACEALSPAVARLSALATADERDFARRLLESPGAQRTAAPEAYHLAALAIALYSEEIESKPHPFRGAARTSALTLLQLLVDLVLRSPDAHSGRRSS